MNIISKVTINGKTCVNGRYVNLTGQNITITDRGMHQLQSQAQQIQGQLDGASVCENMDDLPF